jgi:BirA family biotin operon repressor/biotin-[acetyl-CoA-carboxylase] ligase
VWRLPVPPAAWGGLLSVLLGWAFCTGLQDLGIEARVKWPNDILVGGRKTGGLLLEERGDVFLAGLGLNLVSCPADQDLREDRACSAGVLKAFLPDIPLFQLWLHLVNSAQLRYRTALSALTPGEFSRSVATKSAYLGTTVHVGDDRSSVRGTYVGLAPDGGIVLRTDDGERTLYSGSLRPEE